MGVAGFSQGNWFEGSVQEPGPHRMNKESALGRTEVDRISAVGSYELTPAEIVTIQRDNDRSRFEPVWAFGGASN